MTLVLLMVLPWSQPLAYSADVCEHNTVLNCDGTVRLEQWIWWEWDWSINHGYDYYVRDWRLASDVPWPIANVQEWDDRRSKKRLRVVSKSFERTWSTYDRETHDRMRVPEQDRRRFGVP